MSTGKAHSKRPPVYRACDLCHRKKIRCDRRDPCENCVESSLPCRRTRLQQVRRPGTKSPGEQQIDTVFDRISRLEKLVTGRLLDDSTTATATAGNTTRASPRLRSPFAPSRQVGDYSPPVSEAGNDDSTSPLAAPSTPKPTSNPPRRSSSIFGQSTDGEEIRVAYASVGDQAPATVEAQIVIRNAIDANQGIDSQRRGILEQAVRISHDLGLLQESNDGAQGDGLALVNMDDEPFPSIEYLHSLLHGNYENLVKSYCLEYSSHVSRQTLEMMGLALVNRSVQGQTRLQYIICVDFYVFAFLSGIISDEMHSGMQPHLEATRNKYKSYIIKALEELTILTTPSMTMLQATISGAMFCQDIGHPGRAWQLTSNACQICVALGGRYLANLALDSASSVATEVRRCFANCYVMDKALSMAFHRPPCLPDLHINLNVLSPQGEDPAHDVLIVFLSFAQMQDLMARETRRTESATVEQKIEFVDLLEGRMNDLQAKISMIRSTPRHATDNAFKSEWIGIDFVSYALLTTILRLHPLLDTMPSLQQKTLQSARSALHALHNLHCHLLETVHSSTILVSSFSWTLLCYPLAPFFVVFCNAVANSDREDYRLIKNVADTLATVREGGQSIRYVRRLSQELVALCRPLVENPAPSKVQDRSGSGQGSSSKSSHSRPPLASSRGHDRRLGVYLHSSSAQPESQSQDGTQNHTQNQTLDFLQPLPPGTTASTRLPHTESATIQHSPPTLTRRQASNAYVAESNWSSSVISTFDSSNDPDETSTWDEQATITSSVDDTNYPLSRKGVDGAPSLWVTQDIFWQNIDPSKVYQDWFAIDLNLA